MTTLRLTAIRCLCRDRGLERVKDSVVLKKVYGCSVNGNTGDSKPPTLSSNLSTYANLVVDNSTEGAIIKYKAKEAHNGRYLGNQRHTL
jgi:hypothetical protein